MVERTPQQTEQTQSTTQRQDNRRHMERRHASAGGRWQGERRRFNRRHMAGFGLMAALALGGLRYQTRAMPSPADAPADTLDDELAADGGIEADDDGVFGLDDLEPIIQEAAATHGVDADLIRAVIQTESQFNPTALSPAGAAGLMQLMPKTARSLGLDNPFDPRENVFTGVKYMGQLLERYNGNTAIALAAYNAGPGNVARHRGVPPFRETRGYVSKIAKLVAGSDAAFSVPAYRKPAVRRASVRSSTRRASVRRASVQSRSTARRATRVRARTTTTRRAPRAAQTRG